MKARPIQIKEFVVGNSDVDVITERSLINVDFDPAFLTRLEVVPTSWFTPGTPQFEQETMQGYVPVEKIQLGRSSLGSGANQGDGVGEIYSARPTFAFDPRIFDTPYYKGKTNHPVLLALRYLRQVAITYYRLYGKEYPDRKKLMALVDDKSNQTLRHIFRNLLENPEALTGFLTERQFRSRLNKALGKAFRSYTNPTAAKLLFEIFQVDVALRPYGKRIDPFHTLAYRKYRNPADIAAQRAQINPLPPVITTVGDYFKERGLEPGPDGNFEAYHGTDTMENYRGIVYQGNVASTGGSAGAGVYVVDERSRSFAENWHGPGTLVVKLKIAPGATLVDLTQPEAKLFFQAFKAHRAKLKWKLDGAPTAPSHTDEYTDFADFLGVDVLRYQYGKTHAYVIKDGAAIKGQEPYTIPLLTLAQVKAHLAKSPDPVREMAKLGGVDQGLWAHWGYLMDDYVARDMAFWVRRLLQVAAGIDEFEPKKHTRYLTWDDQPHLRDSVAHAMVDLGIREGKQDALAEAAKLLVRPDISPALAKRIDDILPIALNPQLIETLTRKKDLTAAQRKILAASMLKAYSYVVPSKEMVQYYAESFPDGQGVVNLFVDNVTFQTHPENLDLGAALFDPENPVWGGSRKSRRLALESIVDYAGNMHLQTLPTELAMRLFSRPGSEDMRDCLVKIVDQIDKPSRLKDLVGAIFSREPWSKDVPLTHKIAEKILKAAHSDEGLRSYADVLVPFYLEHSGKPLPLAIRAFTEAESLRKTREQPGLRALVRYGFGPHYPGEIPEAALDKLIRTARDFDVLDDILEQLIDRPDVHESTRHQLAFSPRPRWRRHGRQRSLWVVASLRPATCSGWR